MKKVCFRNSECPRDSCAGRAASSVSVIHEPGIVIDKEACNLPCNLHVEFNKSLMFFLQVLRTVSTTCSSAYWILLALQVCRCSSPPLLHSRHCACMGGRRGRRSKVWVACEQDVDFLSRIQGMMTIQVWRCLLGLLHDLHFAWNLLASC